MSKDLQLANKKSASTHLRVNTYESNDTGIGISWHRPLRRNPFICISFCNCCILLKNVRTITVKNKGKLTMFTLNCRGRLLTIDNAIVMGIINVTPDSFYSGSRAATTDAALKKAEQMITEGATILDVGGQSTRPGSSLIGSEEEALRILPVIEAIGRAFPEIFISVDTFYSAVVEQSVAAGASLVNDVSCGAFDEKMIGTVAKLKVPYICMHMKGTPQNMQQEATYENVTREVVDYFIEKVAKCNSAGINDIVIDPGFGFGKTITHNFELLRNFAVFKIFEKPLLLGISRKSTIYKTLGITADAALNGTTVLHTIGLLSGADILRAHDVKEAVEAVRLATKYGVSV